MKLSVLIQALQDAEKAHGGDIEVQLQGPLDHTGKLNNDVCGFPNFWTVPEEYPDDGWVINLRTWPY